MNDDVEVEELVFCVFVIFKKEKVVGVVIFVVILVVIKKFFNEVLGEGDEDFEDLMDEDDEEN